MRETLFGQVFSDDPPFSLHGNGDPNVPLVDLAQNHVPDAGNMVAPPAPVVSREDVIGAIVSAYGYGHGGDAERAADAILVLFQGVKP